MSKRLRPSLRDLWLGKPHNLGIPCLACNLADSCSFQYFVDIERQITFVYFRCVCGFSYLAHRELMPDNDFYDWPDLLQRISDPSPPGARPAQVDVLRTLRDILNRALGD